MVLLAGCRFVVGRSQGYCRAGRWFVVGQVAGFCWQVAGRLYVSARQVSGRLQVSASILLLNKIMFSRHFSDDNIYSCLLRRY